MSRFLSSILLPKIREDIFQNKKLNSHLYEALKKSIYKPAAFFKGIVLELCSQPDVTLKEATIVASVLAKMSVPVLHSAAALVKLAKYDYSGPRSIFIKTLLDKKYALPSRAVDSLVEYFGKFAGYDDDLPVLWHQSLLIFAQRYKGELNQDQRALLKGLLQNQYHDQISAEILRELDQTMDCCEPPSPASA
jgi:essential nuclear protein 1